MHKIKYVLLAVLLLFVSVLPCSAKEYSRLYLIKKAQKANLDNYTKMYLREYKYVFKSSSSYFVQEPKIKNYDGTYHVITIKQNGSDCYFYYYTNNKDADLTKKLIKRIKISGLKTKKVKKEEIVTPFYQEALTVASNKNKSNSTVGAYNQSSTQVTTKTKEKYDFSDEAQAEFDKKQARRQKFPFVGNKNTNATQQQIIAGNSSTATNVYPIGQTQQTLTSTIQPDVFNASSTSLKGKLVYIQAGTQINATLQSDISSESTDTNDTITAILERDWYHQGYLVAPAGSILYGNVVDTKKAGYAYGNGEISIKFNELLTMDGQKITLPNNTVKLTTGISRTVKVAAKVIAGTLVGVGMGALYAGLSDRKDTAASLATGAVLGGLFGGLEASTQRGASLELPAGTNIQITLKEAFNIAPNY